MILDHDGQFDIIPVTTGAHSDLGWYEGVCTRCDARSGNNAEPYTEEWVENHALTRCTPTPSNQLRQDIAANTKNFGELGKYIRVEHVYNLLDRYGITAPDGTRQLNQRDQIIAELQSSGTGLYEMRGTLERIYRILNP